MINSTLNRISSYDWKFIRGLSLNSIGIAFGRVLGFSYSFIIAREFTTAEFGQVLYALTLSGVVVIIVKPFYQHVVAYYLGKYRNEEIFDQIMPNVWMVALGTYILTLLIGIPILLATSRFSWELLIIVHGTIAYFAYYGVASGFLASKQLVASYVGSNLAQTLLLLVLLFVFNVHSTGPVIAVWGLSYFVPILLLMKFAPLNARIRIKGDRQNLIKVVRFSIPIWLSHFLYVGFISLDILFLERFVSDSEIGIYSLTKTLVSVFYFVPNGITMILLPKLAGMDAGRKQVVSLAMAVSLVVNLVGLTLYMLLYRWFVTSFFGVEYFLNMEFAFVAALGAILFGMHSVLSSTFVGMGHAVADTISRVFMTSVTIAGGLLLIPDRGAMGASITLASAAAAGLVIFLLYTIVVLRKIPAKTPEITQTEII